jgi:hypothetical protein
MTRKEQEKQMGRRDENDEKASVPITGKPVEDNVNT